MTEVQFPGLGIDWTLNRNVLEIGSFSIKWYGLLIMCGVLFAIFYVYRRFHAMNFKTDDLYDLAIFTVIFGVLGARLYFVIFSLDSYVTGEGFFRTLLSMIAIWEGGLGIYGGVIVGALTIYLVCRKKKLPALAVFDMIVPAVIMAQAIGRWGNFVNGEAHGALTQVAWRMCVKDAHFPSHYGMFPEWGYHPTFLYESLWNFVGFFLLNWFYGKKKHDGEVLCGYIGWYGFGRMFIEVFRMDSLCFNQAFDEKFGRMVANAPDFGTKFLMIINKVSVDVGFIMFVIGLVGIILMRRYVKANGPRLAKPVPAEEPAENEESAEQAEENEDGEDH